MKSKTKVTTTNPRSISLRTTVPREIIKALELEKGDEIEWILEAVDNNLQVSVEKAE